MSGPESVEADWRPRVPPAITARVTRYAETHPRAGRPLSRNDAALELLEAALRAADLLGAPLRAPCESVDAPP